MGNLKYFLLLCAFVIMQQEISAQRFHLFSDEMKKDYPSVVYDFLERYLYETDSLMRRGIDIRQKLRDDKVLFTAGSAANARNITPEMPFSISKVDNKYYEVVWADTTGNTMLSLAFAMQYELLLGKPKTELEKTVKDEICAAKDFTVVESSAAATEKQEDGCMMTQPIENYYVNSFNTATYYRSTADSLRPVFDSSDKWHSAANLFLGCIDKADQYTLYVDQNIYGFKKQSFTMKLSQWLAYCQEMKLKVFFTIEEEHADGLKALLIAQSDDLKFNHMMSIVIPDTFIDNPKPMIKVTFNAYIPTQNIKDLYQQYVKKKKKNI
jgi:hypothetical protein